MGLIGDTPTDLRPSPAKRTIPQEVTDVSIYAKGQGLLAHRHIGNVSWKHNGTAPKWKLEILEAATRERPTSSLRTFSPQKGDGAVCFHELLLIALSRKSTSA